MAGAELGCEAPLWLSGAASIIRVCFDDLMTCKRKDDAARAKVLEQPTAETQEPGMGY